MRRVPELAKRVPGVGSCQLGSRRKKPSPSRQGLDTSTTGGGTVLEKGQMYRGRDGWLYYCLEMLPWGDYALLRKVSDGWSFYAYNITLYPDGMIEWEYSTGGRFE